MKYFLRYSLLYLCLTGCAAQGRPHEAPVAPVPEPQAQGHAGGWDDMTATPDGYITYKAYVVDFDHKVYELTVDTLVNDTSPRLILCFEQGMRSEVAGLLCLAIAADGTLIEERLGIPGYDDDLFQNPPDEATIER